MTTLSPRVPPQESRTQRHERLVWVLLLLLGGAQAGRSDVSREATRSQHWLSRLRSQVWRPRPSLSLWPTPSQTPVLPQGYILSNDEADDVDVASEEQEDYFEDYRPRRLPLLQSLRNIVRDPRLARWSASCLQVALLLYLAHSVWSAVGEVLSEISSDTAPVVKPDDLNRLLAFLDQDPSIVATALEKQTGSLPSLPTLQLARMLVSSGLPLTTDHEDKPSVESVLSQLTRTEASILQQCLWVPPLKHLKVHETKKSLEKQWDQIAGLETVKERLLGALSSTLSENHEYSALFQSSNPGILLFGPPGCGKTMLVRALATTASIPCLVVTPSVLLRKFVGETNSQVRSLFSLLHKLAPCILCIDELDGIFRERNDNEHDVSRDLKTEFLQWWDGLLSQDHKPILVIGATNRPFDVDSAVLRRLPQSHYVGLPDASARRSVIDHILRSLPTKDLHNLMEVAHHTEGYSPSDLKQLVQTAAQMGPLRSRPNRPLSVQDLLHAIPHSPPTPLSPSYRRALYQFSSSVPSDRSSELPVDPSSWKTDYGNFYHLGTMQVDTSTFESLMDIVRQLDEWSDDDEDDQTDDTDFEDLDED